MADKASGIEAAAINLLTRAVELDTKLRFTESIVCYQEGIALLMDVLKVTTDEAKRQRFRQKVSDYMDRAEKLKLHMEQEKKAGKYHEQLHIESDSVGNSYESLFGKFFDPPASHVEVEDPYIRSIHQIYNFLRFCELAIKMSKGRLQTIKLTTGKDAHPDAQNLQRNKLSEIQQSLTNHNVNLQIEISDTLHDREIRLDNGWIIKIGRGLDYFKASSGKFAIGFCDYDLRPCHETTIDIFHKKSVKPS